jgi:hypothetical protein
MGKETLTPEEQLLATTRQKLSKYGSPQLLSKLKSGAFFKMSKEVAVSILEKRGEDVSEFKLKVDEKSPIIKETAPAKPLPVEKIKEVKVTKVKVTKIKVEGVERKKRTILDTDQAAEILKRSAAGESTFKIRVAMDLSWSTVNSILLANKI